MSIGGGENVRGQRSCGASESGVVLSDWQGVAPIGTVHHLEDITAEVDEREEYSNDFESSNGSRRQRINIQNDNDFDDGELLPRSTTPNNGHSHVQNEEADNIFADDTVPSHSTSIIQEVLQV